MELYSVARILGKRRIINLFRGLCPHLYANKVKSQLLSNGFNGGVTAAAPRYAVTQGN